MRAPTAAGLRAWSRERREPSWLTARRLAALEKLKGGVRHDSSVSLRSGPLREPLRAPELEEQGVEVLTLRRALETRGELLEARLGAIRTPDDESEAARDAAMNSALWTDGYFVRVPAGVSAALPVQLGSDLSRPALERTVVIVEDGGSLSLVEGCAGGAGSAARRVSVLEAFVGTGASLRAASVQAWAPGVSYRSWKLVSAGPAARVEWLDGNLGAAETAKSVRVSLGEGATARVELAGFAGPGQSQRLEAFAEGGAAELASRTAVKGGRLRPYLLAGPGASVSRSEAVLDLAGLPEAQLFYLATRGLEGRAADSAVAHAFFEPFARRLPLEFSVEFTRLLDAELT